jgi:hypothetical protein
LDKIRVEVRGNVQKGMKEKRGEEKFEHRSKEASVLYFVRRSRHPHLAGGTIWPTGHGDDQWLSKHLKPGPVSTGVTHIHLVIKPIISLHHLPTFTLPLQYV